MDSSYLIKNKKSVPKEFDSVAKKYDLATFLSQGYQGDLNLSAERMKLNDNIYIADLCCGTGKSTQACIENIDNGKILAVDNSKEMLNIAKKKIKNENVSFRIADVMELDYDDNTFDAIFMAYGIRNMPDYHKCLVNLRRMLKPGGIICFHEYSLHENRFSHYYWKFLGYFVIIPLSAILSGSSAIYKYLVKSVLSFPSPDRFTSILEECGFTDISKLNMPSWRKPILHTFLAHK